MTNRAVIALGSNIQPEENIKIALTDLSEIFSLVDKSRFRYTQPLGYKDQSNFLNGAVLIKTQSGKIEIESILKMIEQKLGRNRNGRKDGPRKIDLDLVLYNGRVLDDDVYERDFLQQFVEELVPDFELSQ